MHFIYKRGTHFPRIQLKTKGIFLFLFILWNKFIHALVTWQQIGNDIHGTNEWDAFASQIELNADGTIVAIGAQSSDDPFSDAGRAGIYEWNGTNWAQLGSDILGTAAYNDQYLKLSMNDAGNIVAIGSGYNDNGGSNAGEVRVFEYNGTEWTQLGADIRGNVGDGLGSSVSLNSNGHRLAVGAYGANQCKIYEYSSGTWTQLGSTIQGASESYFGSDVQMNDIGDVIVVGAYYDSTVASRCGAVRVYEYSDSVWSQIGSTIYGNQNEAQLGYSVAINGAGNIMATGAYNSGAGYGVIYEHNGTEWNQLGDDIYGSSTGDSFGLFVSLNKAGDIFAGGAIFGDISATDAGYIRVYRYNGTWNQIGQTISGKVAGDELARVSLSANAIHH